MIMERWYFFRVNQNNRTAVETLYENGAKRKDFVPCGTNALFPNRNVLCF